MKISIMLLLVGQLLIISCGGNSNGNNKTETSISKSTNKEKKKPILDLTKVANKTEKEVETVLGKAEKTEEVKGYPCEITNCLRTFYNSGKVEIIFKRGKADRITINGTADYTNDENALENFGLQNEKPNFKNPSTVIRWEYTQNFAEISCFTNYVLIQVTK